MNSEDFIAAARDYDERGWHVIPLHRVGPDGKTCSCRRGGNCATPGKHPKDEGWQKSPRMSAADIQATWDSKYPPNIGLATGEMSGFWVLDIDPEHGGFEAMKALVAEHGALPATFVVQTGSGGYHYYFALPGFELRNSSNRVGPGIDTRASGGQVVAPPSRSNKGDYTVVSDAPVAAAPAWLLEAARKSEPTTAPVTAEDLPRPEEIDEQEWARLNGYATKVIEREVRRLLNLHPDVWEANGAHPWNHTVFQVACTLVEMANSPWNSYSLHQAYSDVKQNSPRDAGFDDATIEKCWHSATAKVGQGARAVPENRQPQRAPDEPDPLLSSPDVRRLGGPTEADGAESRPAGGTTPWDFFDKADLLVAKLASAVMAEGPIAWGRDEAFWSYVNGVWVPDPAVVSRRGVELLGDKCRNGHIANCETVVRHRAVELTGDPQPDLMNFRNGMLNWRTGELLPHEPGYRSTVQLGVDWTPEETCPTFDSFLGDVMHADYVDLAWEMLGYLMYSGNPLQTAFLLYGSGGNGKGTLMRIIEDLLGRENVASESLDDLNGNRFSAVNLFGKIANLAGDIDGTYQESTANFKKLTGEDTYAGERKFGQRFNFQSWAVPVFSANKIPGSADVTEGYLRRWVVLHFHKKIENMIPGFSDRLASELPGIAVKAVGALRRVMARGKFAPQGEAVKGKEEFALQIDQVRQWAASGDAISSPGTLTPLMDLYASYSLWAGRSGQGRLREAEFSHRLEAIGFERTKAGSMAHHSGLTVATAEQRSVSSGFF